MLEHAGQILDGDQGVIVFCSTAIKVLLHLRMSILMERLRLVWLIARTIMALVIEVATRGAHGKLISHFISSQ